jgi:lysyl-tRNA synthetase class 1
VDSLLYFMYLKPQQTKKMGLPLLPSIVDQYMELVSGHDGSMDSPVPFVSRLSKGAHAEKLTGGKTVTYSMIYDLIVALNETHPEIVREYLVKYQPEIAANISYYDELIEKAIIYYREVFLPTKVEEEAGHEHDEALSALLAGVEGMEKSGAAPEPEAIQSFVFSIAKERQIKPKDWFRTLYRVFLKQSSGPKVGSFIALLGYAKTMERIKGHLKGNA